jgi:very-short-patch-repair endonuclease
MRAINVLLTMSTIDITHPEVAAQWHPTKNGDLRPSDVSFGTHTKVWWLCPKTCTEGCLHEWEATIKSRTNGRGCPYCSKPIKKNCKHTTIDYLYPDIVSQWHPTKNEKRPDQFNAGSDEKVWWLCPNTCPSGCLHEWQTAIKLRCLKNYSCPFCSNQKILCEHISIATTHSQVAQQWHPTLNTSSPCQFVAGSDEKAWWLCPKTCPNGCIHQWQTQIKHRCLNNLGCPFCSKQKVSCECVSIVKTHPELIKEWHTEKNINISPSSFSHGSGKKVWWKCDKHHEWQAIISSRTKGNGCPYCMNKTEAKLYDYLCRNFTNVQAQFRPEWIKPHRFDFCIPSLKLLLELDGPQHFRQVSNWTSHTETQKRDVFKMITAQTQGYSVIRLLQEEVYDATDEWLNELLLPHLTATEEPKIHPITKPEKEALYAEHQRLLELGELPTFVETPFWGSSLADVRRLGDEEDEEST